MLDGVAAAAEDGPVSVPDVAAAAPPPPGPGLASPTMGDTFDVDAMIGRFRDRAHAVKQRPLPPVAGEERQRFIQQAQDDYQDFAMIGDAVAELDDGILVLRVDLRPPSARS